MLFNEFIKEHKKVEELEGIVASLAATVKGQTAQIQKVSAQLAAASPSRGGLEVSKTYAASGQQFVELRPHQIRLELGLCLSD